MQVRVFIGPGGDQRECTGRRLGVFTVRLELLGTTVSWRGGVVIPFCTQSSSHPSSGSVVSVRGRGVETV